MGEEGKKAENKKLEGGEETRGMDEKKNNNAEKIGSTAVKVV